MALIIHDCKYLESSVLGKKKKVVFFFCVPRVKKVHSWTYLPTTNQIMLHNLSTSVKHMWMLKREKKVNKIWMVQWNCQLWPICVTIHLLPINKEIEKKEHKNGETRI